MKKKLLVSAFLIYSAVAFCITVNVGNSGTTFSPATVTINLGDTVKFVLSASHNSIEVSQATWNANGNTALSGGFSTPFSGGLVLPDKLTPGTHYYVCAPHASIGMKGIIVVKGPTTAVPTISPWGLFIIGILFMLAGVRQMKNRRIVRGNYI